MFLLIFWHNSHEANCSNINNNFYAYTNKLWLELLMENFYLWTIQVYYVYKL
jgi:hypothetical protein